MDNELPAISEGDIEATTIERRTFLGRFGVVAGLVGIAGVAQACSTAASDAEGGAASDSDAAAEPASDADQAPTPDAEEEPEEESSDADAASDSNS